MRYMNIQCAAHQAGTSATRTKKHIKGIHRYGVLSDVHEHPLASAKELARQRSQEKRQWGSTRNVLNKHY